VGLVIGRNDYHPLSYPHQKICKWIASNEDKDKKGIIFGTHFEAHMEVFKFYYRGKEKIFSEIVSPPPFLFNLSMFYRPNFIDEGKYLEKNCKYFAKFILPSYEEVFLMTRKGNFMKIVWLDKIEKMLKERGWKQEREKIIENVVLKKYTKQ
jgi:hypothetical protein